MNDKDINNLKEMLVDFNEYSTDYTKTRCKELEKTINNTLQEIERLNNIINIILDFNLFKDECPLCLGYLEKCDEEKAQDVFYEEEYCENCSDDYKKCWLKYFNRLQELKGSDKSD